MGVLRLGAWSPHVQAGFHVSRPTQGPHISCIRTGLSPSNARLSRRFRLLMQGHWPDPRSLATTNGVSSISFPTGTEMFQSPAFASMPYVFRHRYPKGVGFPIRTSRDQSSLAAPPGLSQPNTSFIASMRQGIHQTPLTYFHSPVPPHEGKYPAKHRTSPTHADQRKSITGSHHKNRFVRTCKNTRIG